MNERMELMGDKPFNYPFILTDRGATNLFKF